MSNSSLESSVQTDTSSLGERLIFQTSKHTFIWVSLLLLIVKVGINPLPAFYKIAIVANDPFQNNLNATDFYLMWNWLVPYLAWLLHLTNYQVLLILHLLLSVAFIVLVMYGLFTKLSDNQARISVIIFLMLPVSGSTLHWISYDGPSLLLIAIALLFVKNKFGLFTIGLALGLQDFEPALLGFGALALASLISNKAKSLRADQFQHSMFVIAGLIVGRTILTFLFNHWNIRGNSGRLSWILENSSALINQFIKAPYLFLWSVLGLAWIVIAMYRYTHVRLSPDLVIPLVLLATLSLITVDKTRVMGFATFPLLCTYWLLNPAFLERISRKTTEALALIWLVVPWIWVIEGGSYGFSFNIVRAFLGN